MGAGAITSLHAKASSALSRRLRGSPERMDDAIDRSILVVILTKTSRQSIWSLRPKFASDS